MKNTVLPFKVTGFYFFFGKPEKLPVFNLGQKFYVFFLVNILNEAPGF
jgi:hypothetical protein